MRDPNIKAAVTLVITEDGEIGLAKSEKVDWEIMASFIWRMVDELGIIQEGN